MRLIDRPTPWRPLAAAVFSGVGGFLGAPEAGGGPTIEFAHPIEEGMPIPLFPVRAAWLHITPISRSPERPPAETPGRFVHRSARREIHRLSPAAIDVPTN